MELSMRPLESKLPLAFICWQTTCVRPGLGRTSSHWQIAPIMRLSALSALRLLYFLINLSVSSSARTVIARALTGKKRNFFWIEALLKCCIFVKKSKFSISGKSSEAACICNRGNVPWRQAVGRKGEIFLGEVGICVTVSISVFVSIFVFAV